MSFLLEEEGHVTLAEALAFIDTFAFEDVQDIDREDWEDESGSASDHSSESDASSSSPLYVELHLPPTSSSPASHSATAAKSYTNISSPGGYSSSSTSCSPNSPANSTGSSSGSGSGSDDVMDEQQKRLLKTRAANTRAVNRYRKRNKNEILELREEVLHLNAYLAQLRKRGAVETSSSSSTANYFRSSATTAKLLQLKGGTASSSVNGINEAVNEFRKLQQSEALNRRLREALAKQRNINSTLGSIFQRQIAKNVYEAENVAVVRMPTGQSIVQDLTFVLDIERQLQKQTPSEPRMVPPMARDSSMIYSQLFHYLRETVYTSTPAVLSMLHRNDIECVFNNTLVKNDPKHGKMLEFMSNAPVNCNLSQLDALLWAHLTHPSDSEALEESFAQASQNPPCERQFTLNFSAKLGDVHMDGMSAIRKFVEPHRIVFAYTSLLVPYGSNLLFRENGWLISSDAHISGCTSAPAVFQTFYRLYAEDQFNSGTTPKKMSPETNALHNFVMNSQGEKMRAYQLMMQNMLVYQLDKISGGGILSKCTTVEVAAT